MNPTYPTPPVTPANLIDSEPWSDDWLMEDLIDLTSEESDPSPEQVTMTSTWPITTLETLAHSYSMVNTSLKDYYEAWYQERRAHMHKTDILTQQVVPYIIQLAHTMYNPQPNNYQGLLRQLTRTTLQEHGLVDAFRAVWGHVIGMDDWIQQDAGGPAFPWPEDVMETNNDNFLAAAFGVTDALGWAMEE
ncbi:hypothetical protein BCR42DRAFT_433769 [Absidia repens]|uniref:Uncharacterized protein n=1 Tax=Absidia repens TaxID=90262 RepID=A0A1X2IUH9_9FUNG|nr:hypothetical protein BCR42DRAFT_433769 [Absidia repens]